MSNCLGGWWHPPCPYSKRPYPSGSPYWGLAHQPGAPYWDSPYPSGWPYCGPPPAE